MNSIRHIYVHIPFCARICPYCAFYKDLLDRSQTWRFCEAILRDLDQRCGSFALTPETIYFGGGTPTALTTSQLEFLLGGFHERLDLSSLAEWTIEANPGSVSARKAELLHKLGVTRVSLGIQSWEDELLKHLRQNTTQASQAIVPHSTGCRGSRTSMSISCSVCPDKLSTNGSSHWRKRSIFDPITSPPTASLMRRTQNSFCVTHAVNFDRTRTRMLRFSR